MSERDRLHLVFNRLRVNISVNSPVSGRVGFTLEVGKQSHLCAAKGENLIAGTGGTGCAATSLSRKQKGFIRAKTGVQID